MYDKNQNGTTNAQLTVDDVKNSDLGFDELTEEQFENATDAVQVRNLIEINYTKAFDRDDVEKKIELRAGNQRYVEHTSHGWVDNRRRIALYKIPDGWFYFVGDEVYTYYEYDQEKPDFRVFFQDAIEFIEHAVEEKDHAVDEAYDIKYDDDHKKLRNKIKQTISGYF